MYEHLQLHDAKALQQKVALGIIADEGLFDERIFAHVCLGISSSPHAAPKYQKYYTDQTSSFGNPINNVTANEEGDAGTQTTPA